MKIVKRVLAGIALVYGAISARIFLNVSKPKTSSHETAEEYDLNIGSYDSDFTDKLDKEEVKIQSNKGYELYGWWSPSEGAKRTVILVHGITSNIFGMLKYYDLYHRKGFNVLMYDHRNHGLSGGKNTTLGYHEKEDLETCVQWVRARVGDEGIISTHGESMGAAVAIQHAGIYGSVDFLVADCPFADLNKQLLDVIKREQKLPLWVGLPGASLLSKVSGNGWYKQSSPMDVIEDVTMPLLIIHGEADTYITPDHAQALYDGKINGYRQLFYANNADHAESIIKDKDNYYKIVEEFIETSTSAE